MQNYQGSKWLKVPILCDLKELDILFQNPFFLVPLTGISNGKPLEKVFFLDTFQSWIAGLKQGKAPQDRDLKKILAAAMTQNLEDVYRQEIPGKGFLTRILRPVIQISAHFFTYSKVDGVFRSMTLGEGSIFWGLLFSFPQLYQDPQTMEIRETPKNPLFETIRRWTREVSLATPFRVGDQRTNVPIRLGKSCFSWIHEHPGLKEQGIEVVC